jgi:hypothetical protein
MIPPNPQSPLERESDVFTDRYSGTLATEKSTSIAELHNATTWGLTLTTTGILFIIGRGKFPDQVSLYGLFFLAVFATHFYVRAMKGYINVVRWSLLQRLAIRNELDGYSDVSTTEWENAVRLYHLHWTLPLLRRTVFWKGTFELGFGYLFAVLASVLIYVASQIQMNWGGVVAGFMAAAMMASEMMMFLMSPYMRNSMPDESAQRFR